MSVYTKEMHMEKKLNDYILSDEERKIILDEFTRTKEEYYRTGFLERPAYMPFKEIIHIIAGRNGIQIEPVLKK